MIESNLSTEKILENALIYKRLIEEDPDEEVRKITRFRTHEYDCCPENTTLQDIRYYLDMDDDFPIVIEDMY